MQPIRKMWETARPVRPVPPPAALGAGWKRRLPMIALAALFLVAAGSSLFFYRGMLAAKAVSVPSAQAQGDSEAAELVAKAGKLMLLPSDETPTVATVSDPAKLADQAFFAHAKTGDKVLIYARAKKAILYSPTDNRIVEVAAINLDGATPAAETR